MFFKYLIPFDRSVIDSPLTPEDAAEAILIETDLVRLVGFSVSGLHAFRGDVSGSRFRIRRILDGTERNAFIPIVIGRIEPAGDGSRIHIHMRPMWFIVFVMLAWIVFIIPDVRGVVLWSVLRTPWDLLFPFGMILTAAVVIGGGFWPEASRQKQMLTAVFLTPMP